MRGRDPREHAVRMDEWTALVAAHAGAATIAMVLGAAQLLRRRFGDRLHR